MLHIALENYVQAAPTAVIIAKQEQELGNYNIVNGTSNISVPPY